MLILLEGGFTSVMHGELIKKIQLGIDGGKRIFLFVPEQQTLTTEKQMCELLPPSAVLNFEVTNFTRFTNTAMRTLGGISGEYITPAKRSLMMWSVLTELSPMLNITHGSTNIGAGIVGKAMSAVSELESMGIKPGELAEAERAMASGDARLRSKLSDLSLIYSLYKLKLKEKYCDMTDSIISLAEKIAENPDYLRNTDIYIEGFTSFTEPQYLLIGEMIKHTAVNICLNLPKAGKEGFEYSEPRECESRLIRLADRASAEKKLLKPDAKSAEFNPVIAEIAELLWHIDGKIDNDSLQTLKETDAVKIYEANTPFDECDFVGADIRRRVIAGARYRDFAVIVGNTERYAGILDTSLEKARVPHYMSKKHSISSLEAIRFISSAYAVINGGFKSTDVITYSKCGLAGCKREESDIFEIYVSIWKIDGRRFTDGIEWNMNPNGYCKLCDADAERLKEINRIKNAVISPLLSLRENISGLKTVREHADALLDFLLDTELERRLLVRADELERMGETESADINRRLWQIICDSLDTLVETVGETPADAESFMNQLSVVFADTEVGSIPSYTDEVSIGQADMIRLTDKKHIYLLGVNQGEFPANADDTSYFTDRDKLTLSALGLPFAAGLETKNARECYSFSRAFSFAHSTVRLLYTKKTSSLGTALPSEIIERISDITDNVLKPIPISEIPTEDRIYTPEEALESFGTATPSQRTAIKNALKDTEHSALLTVIDGSLVNSDIDVGEETMAILLGDNIYLSQSKIDKYMRCPLKYFASSVMKLEQTETAEIDHFVVGNFIHAVLEDFFAHVISEKRSIGELTESERSELVSRASRNYIESEIGNTSSAKTDAIIKRICRIASPIVDGLCDEFANCRFTPTHCELRISRFDDSTPDPVIYDIGGGRKAVIEGIVDRVDTLKVGNDVYVRVSDYKTGMKHFSLDGIKDGENLQMMLYLKAITESRGKRFLEEMGVGDGGRLIPAGIVYVKTSVSDVTVSRSSDELALSEVKSIYERLGASLDDSESLAAMNPEFIPMTKPSRNSEAVPLTYSAEDWDALCLDMQGVITDVAKQIAKGRITTDISKSGGFHPCDDCQYKFLCRNVQK